MNARIVSNKEYVAGWLDSTLHDFLDVLSPVASSTKYALITCLDSNPAPALMAKSSPELKRLGVKPQDLGPGLLIPTRKLLDAGSQQRIFFGFDEVWFFPTKSIQPKPTGISLVGPARLNQARFDKLSRSMSDNGCSLALGGGEGLNFVVRAQGLARFLLGYSLEQPAPALAAN